MLLYLRKYNLPNTNMIMYTSQVCYTLMLITMLDLSRASHELRRSESKKAKLEELSNKISER